MISKASIVISLLILSGCISIPESKIDYTGLVVSDGELLKAKWSSLKRFSARYPLASAKASKSGCVTVKYVITPEYKIENVVVTDSTNKDFSRSSKDVISKWKWSGMPKGLLSSAIKTQTRFNFCVESESRPCAEVIKNFSCAGTDVISSIGIKIRRRQ